MTSGFDPRVDPVPLPILGPSRIAGFLAATLATVEAEMAAAGDDVARWRPAVGEWSANEVVGHLIEAERRGFAGRIETILASDRPHLEAWDQGSVAAARDDALRRPSGVLDEFRDARRSSLRLVTRLVAADLERIGIHPVIGEVGVGDLLAEWVHHDRNHVRQLLANVQACAWPQMGAARRFSDPTA